MAKKIYDEKIGKSTDWGGDNSTGGLPVSGRRVQEFIKESLNTLENDLGNIGKSKYGYSRIVDEKFLQQFADSASADLYDKDPIKNENLLLNSVQLPGTGETVALMRVTVLETPAEYTTQGMTEKFKFHYLSYYNDETDLSSVRGEAILKVNDIELQRIELRSGSTYELDVTTYLTEEKNTIQITVSNNEGSTRNFVYDVNIVSLSISSSFDDSVAYKDAITFRYTPIGDILKTVRFVLDEEEIYSEKTTANNRQLTYEIPAQSHGAHLLQVYMTADIMGNTIQSNTLSYDIICVEEGNMTPIIASAFAPSSVRQYETITIPFVVYDPAGSPVTIQLFVNGEQASERSVDRTRQTWTYRANEKGELDLKIQCKGVVKEFTFDITESIVTSEAETQDLELYLTSQGRSNQDTNREEWKYNDIAASFTGMNWVANGWVTDEEESVCLRLSGGATANIPLQIFTGDIRQSGKTIELDFSVREVTDYNAIILSCLAGDVGLKLTPNTISLASEQSKVEMQYKENERVRVSFVIEKRTDNRLMQIFVNGIKSQSFQYPETDGFTQANPVGISMGSTSATIDLYNIRVYSNNLNTSQILNNYIADIDNIEKKIAVFERNQVYDSYGSLSLSELNRQIPVMTIIGDLPNYKGDKKTVRIEYNDLKKPEKSFAADGCTLDVQGTSSQYYPRKNFKFTAKQGFEMVQGGHADAFTLNEEECLPATVFCTKADFAESSGTHNTGIADYVGWMLREAGILTKPQESNPVIRTTVYGEPCVIFHKKNENSIAEFIGKYNFNTDKGAENTFGFADGDESWEFLNNTSDLALFKTADFTDWKDTLEARFPDGYEQIEQTRRVFEWVVSCKDNPEKFKEELEQYFDKKKLLFYYIITLVFGMVDQRAKNQFLTFYKGGLWLFIFYDNDTCFGINNEGAMAFSYNVEIHDKIGSQAVWNGADSELWILVENAFASELQELYYDLRQKGILSYDKTIEYTNTRQSEKWCEAVYNEDGYFKYERPLIEGYEDWSSGSPVLTKTGAYLYALQGSRDAHRRWWLYNRFKYLDSKFQAGSSLSDYATFRTYTPADWKGVAPNADITIKSFAAMYGTIKWGSVTKSERMEEGETKTIKAPDMQFNDTETIVYNASMIASLGNLAPLYVGTVDVSRMTNLTELIIGSGVSGYQNTNFTVLSVGSNHVLRKLDIRNCPKFTANIEVSACEAIEEIYATGTSTTAANLAEGGALRILQLPATVTNLTLKNQPNLTNNGLQLEGMQNLVTIVVENTPQVKGYDMVKECIANSNKLSRIRLINIRAADKDLNALNNMAKLKGIDESGIHTEHAIITGAIHVTTAGEDSYNRLTDIFPDLIITYDVWKPIPPFTLTVVDGSDFQPVSGAKVVIDGTEFTTDNSGTVTVMTSAEVTCSVSKEGYKSVTRTFAASEDARNVTVTLNKKVTMTFNAINNYSLPQKGVMVIFDGEEKVTGNDGKAVFETSKGTYSLKAYYEETVLVQGTYTVTGEADSQEYTLPAATVNIKELKPEPDGSIQMLVKSDSANKITLWIDTLSPCVIDWGDGSAPETFSELIDTPSFDSAKKSVKHIYTDGFSMHQIKVSSCDDVVYCSTCVYKRNTTVQSATDKSMVAYWTIGNSKVCALKFCFRNGNTGSSYYTELQYVGYDIFDNDMQNGLNNYNLIFARTDISETFPFKNIAATDFSNAFAYTAQIKELPRNVFENCQGVLSFYEAFYYCTNLKTAWFPVCAETGFHSNVYNGLFNGCRTLETVFMPQDVPPPIATDTFQGCNALSAIYVPDGSVDAYKTATNWSGLADKIKPISEYTGG